jgi:hypothetical protein
MPPSTIRKVFDGVLCPGNNDLYRFIEPDDRTCRDRGARYLGRLLHVPSRGKSDGERATLAADRLTSRAGDMSRVG